MVAAEITTSSPVKKNLPPMEDAFATLSPGKGRTMVFLSSFSFVGIYIYPSNAKSTSTSIQKTWTQRFLKTI